ncbi:LolA family protein [Amycolatopsis cihanbeyliensis]|uniref:Uncharacterized protein DUF2092 n=1 Tax=Amycolatopsis cihanbeyliensis TaxID=1128664 RepID=A0A542DHS4_AMYCI|nr:DUF2092 domain-containing protein [Amycolatopsis cihanbeyliensis]TQJ02584.1 uncharacterized protein DUF2092 [Amycolatopsis cihanbeyliensis]
MNPKKRAITVAAAGTALGVAGLGLIAMPAGAGSEPQLPEISAEELVESAVSAEHPAFGGTVRVDNQLGLPALPGMDSLEMDAAEVHSNGRDASRLGVRDGNAERTIVQNGNTVWTYDSAENSAKKVTLPGEADRERDRLPREGELSGDPTELTATVLEQVRETSTVAVDGTATVADRAAYELVLTPQPTERTLLREVRVAVDADTRMPLRLAVHTHGTTEPALQVGFSDISFGPQPAELFQFSPPAGATVTEENATERRAGGKEHAEQAKEATDIRVVGDGWDTTLVGSVPAEMLNQQARFGDDEGRADADRRDGRPADVRGLLQQFGKQVTGSFGTGYVITTKVGTALITEDGRFAAGFVPEQVLIQALER